MGFGGPVWHASVAPLGVGLVSQASLREVALSVLDGVGDPNHEWEERGTIAYHVRRRLTTSEAETTGPVRDVRGTWEATKRQNRMRRVLPSGVWLDE